MYKFVVICSLCITPVWAGIQVYTPEGAETQKSVGRSIGGLRDQPEDSVPVHGQEIRVITQEYVEKPTLPRRSAQEDAQQMLLDQNPYLYGQAYAFVDVNSFGPVSAENIKKLFEVKGVQVDAFMSAQDPKAYMQLLDKGLEKLGENVMISVDTKARLATKYRVTRGNVLVYQDPTGTIRRYHLVNEFHKFLRHLKRIKQALAKKKAKK